MTYVSAFLTIDTVYGTLINSFTSSLVNKTIFKAEMSTILMESSYQEKLYIARTDKFAIRRMVFDI